MLRAVCLTGSFLPGNPFGENTDIQVSSFRRPVSVATHPLCVNEEQNEKVFPVSLDWLSKHTTKLWKVERTFFAEKTYGIITCLF
jgi:hypothetical protein